MVPPAVIPETRKRWENRKISSTGATLTTVARASVGRSIVVDAAFVGLNWGTFDSSSARPTCTGALRPGTIT